MKPTKWKNISLLAGCRWENAPLALEEEMMSTLKAARIATSENAENMLYTHHVQRLVKKKKKNEIHSNFWKTCCNKHMASSLNTVILKSIYIIYVQAVHHNCSYVTILKSNKNMITGMRGIYKKNLEKQFDIFIWNPKNWRGLFSPVLLLDSAVHGLHCLWLGSAFRDGLNWQLFLF